MACLFDDSPGNGNEVKQTGQTLKQLQEFPNTNPLELEASHPLDGELISWLSSMHINTSQIRLELFSIKNQQIFILFSILFTTNFLFLF